MRLLFIVLAQAPSTSTSPTSFYAFIILLFHRALPYRLVTLPYNFVIFVNNEHLMSLSNQMFIVIEYKILQSLIFFLRVYHKKTRLLSAGRAF